MTGRSRISETRALRVAEEIVARAFPPGWSAKARRFSCPFELGARRHSVCGDHRPTGRGGHGRGFLPWLTTSAERAKVSGVGAPPDHR